jgi:hypothetical protein
MARDPGTLKAGLLAMTASFPATHGEAAQRWAQAYGGTYAATALALPANVPNVAGATAALTGKLASAFPTDNAAPPMQAAHVEFWTAPPVPFAGAVPGVVTAIGGPPDLAGVFRRNVESEASADAACAALAAELHRFTSTVVVTVATTPTPTVGPIQ